MIDDELMKKIKSSLLFQISGGKKPQRSKKYRRRSLINEVHLDIQLIDLFDDLVAL
jgi:hypothetical protein